MTCEDFVQRMHERLDQRKALEADEQLVQHARNCTNCRSQLDMWAKIAPLMKADLAVPVTIDGMGSNADLLGLRVIPPLLTAGLAAAILIAVVGITTTKTVSTDDNSKCTNIVIHADIGSGDWRIGPGGLVA